MRDDALDPKRNTKTHGRCMAMHALDIYTHTGTDLETRGCSQHFRKLVYRVTSTLYLLLGYHLVYCPYHAEILHGCDVFLPICTLVVMCPMCFACVDARRPMSLTMVPRTPLRRVPHFSKGGKELFPFSNKCGLFINIVRVLVKHSKRLHREADNTDIGEA